MAGAFKILNYMSLVISIGALLPTGDHVCMVNESFTTTVRVEEPYQYRRRKTEWCFKIPPRCSKYDMAWSWRWVDKEVVETRQVPKCCSGYVAGPWNDHCRPFCSSPCKHGVCFAPEECQCEAGFQGKICETSCPRGRWGVNCSEICDCRNGAFCDPVGGICHCAAGWIGKKCEQPCPEGFHGVDCQEECQCGEFTPCHHITGDCIFPTTSTTEPTSTTEYITSITEVSTAIQAPSTTETFQTTSETSTTDFSTARTDFTTFTTDVSVFKTDSSSVITDFSVLTTDSSTDTTTFSVLITSSSAVTAVYSTTTELATSTSVPESTKIPYSPSGETVSTSKSTKTFDLFMNSSTWVPYFSRIPTDNRPTSTNDFTELTEPSTASSATEISMVEVSAVTPDGEEVSSGQELAGLAITIVFSVLGAVVLLIAAAGIALTRHRKMISNQTQIEITDLGIHKFYGEINIPVKTLFNNPTYNCEEIDLQREKPVLRTFTPTQDTFDAELREILEAHYDHPPSIVGQLSMSVEHLYDEIAATYDEARGVTAFRTFS